MMQKIGRKEIFTDKPYIDHENVLDVLSKAIPIYAENASMCNRLIAFRDGEQPLNRKEPKKYRSDIDFHVIDNLAKEAVDFWVSFGWSNPITIIQRGDTDEADKETGEGIAELNNSYAMTGSIGDLQRLADFVITTGIGYTYVDINTDYEDGDSPFTKDVLDPRFAFVVRSSYYTDRRIMLGVTLRVDDDYNYYITAFTKDLRFEVVGSKIVNGEASTYEYAHDNRSGERNVLNRIPIVEWIRATDRTGIFEAQIPALQNINLILSDMSNGIDQNIQSVWLAVDIETIEEEVKNADGTTTTKQKTPKNGDWLFTYTTPDGKTPDAKPLVLDYGLDAMRQTYLSQRALALQKMHVPQRNDNTGSSSGTAMDSASGWSDAEYYASAMECLTIASQNEELRVVLAAIKHNHKLPQNSPLLKLKARDMEPSVRRPRNFELTVRVNAFTTLISHGTSIEDALAAAPIVPDASQFISRSGEGIKKYQEAQVWKETEQEESKSRPFPDLSDEELRTPLIGSNTETSETISVQKVKDTKNEE